MSQEYIDDPGKVRSYRDLLVWQRAMDVVDKIYRISAQFPAFENYGLRSQITRAAVSVIANIAEGQARASSKDFANFLTIARSSLFETDALLQVALRQKYVTQEATSEVISLMNEVSRMLNGLRAAVIRRARTG